MISVSDPYVMVINPLDKGSGTLIGELKLKYCYKCKKTKYESEFNKNRSKHDGLATECKVCNKARVKAYYEANRKKVNERNKAWYEANREQMREYSKDYYEANREQRLKYQKDYYEANREQAAEYRKAYYQANRDKVIARATDWNNNNPERRHNNLLKATYGISRDDYNHLLVEQSDRCAICWTDDPSPRKYWDVDHNHETGEVRGLLCTQCNMELGNLEKGKTNKYILEYQGNMERYLMEPPAQQIIQKMERI